MLCIVAVVSVKTELLQLVREELRNRLQRLADAAMDAHAAATDPGSKAEGKYDTRSLEASYLAAGQSRQVEELAEAVRAFDVFTPPDFAMEDPVAMGALVEVDVRGETSWLLLAPAAGGMVVGQDGREVTLLTPASKLYQSLLGRQVGEYLEESGMLVAEIW